MQHRLCLHSFANTTLYSLLTSTHMTTLNARGIGNASRPMLHPMHRTSIRTMNSSGCPMSLTTAFVNQRSSHAVPMRSACIRSASMAMTYSRSTKTRTASKAPSASSEAAPTIEGNKTATRKPRTPRAMGTSQSLWLEVAKPLTEKPWSKSITEKRAAELKQAGIHSFLDLLLFAPRKHDVYSSTWSSHELEQKVVAVGTVRYVKGPAALKNQATKLDIVFDIVPLRAHHLHGAGGILPGESLQSAQYTIFRFGPYGMGALVKSIQELPVGKQVLLLGTLQAGSSVDWICSSGTKLIDLTDPKHGWTRTLLGLEEDGQPVSTIPDELLLPAYSSRTPLKNTDFFNPEARTRGIMQACISALDQLPVSGGDLDGVPSLTRPHIMPWWQAVRTLHAPASEDDLNVARASLAYHELFLLQLKMLKQRQEFLMSMPGKDPCAPVRDASVWKEALKCLPFSLTAAQTRVLSEVLSDMQQPLAMFRLLQGDVGSGKTVVAMLCMLATAASGSQALLLAPTEILAQQHYHNLEKLVSALPPNIRKQLGGSGKAAGMPALLTGASKESEKRALMKGVQSGDARLVVSTHSAFYTEGWHRLGLVVVDEQHKFGTQQKQKLLDLCDSVHPHILSMSATPIPRTMALAMFGDMEVSIIEGRPPGRQQVATQVLSDDNDGHRAAMITSILKEVETGGRAFIVYPGRGTSRNAEEAETDADEDDDNAFKPKAKKKTRSKTSSKAKKAPATAASTSEVASLEEELDEVEQEALKTATAEFKRLQKERVFGNHKCILLHGAMSSEDKEAAIAAHRAGTHPIMICTSVVEVGVDVPEASIMVVQQAERFGLAQLHQMRGRVGRSSRASTCLLVNSSTATDVAVERLQVLVDCHDGLEIAEHDLRLRGAGALFSSATRQSGTLDCSKLCSQEIIKAPELVLAARQSAVDVLKQGFPNPQQPSHVHIQAAMDAFSHKLGTAGSGFTSAVGA